MDSLITAAAYALAQGDPLGALKRVALRDDAPALALRGIAMAQLGDLVRAKALLRRAAQAETSDATTKISSGDLVIDLVGRTLTVQGKHVRLTRTEWEVIRALATHAGRTLTHQQLFREVWTGRSYGDAPQYLRVQIAHLRRKIERDVVRPRYILTEPGVGYRFAIVDSPDGE